jgi:perosamine synthetase
VIPVSAPSIGSQERELLLKAFDSTWISSRGEFLDEFESEFARRCHARHALSVANGTVALHLALAALGVGPGDEVIMPALTYVATANAVLYCGATPVFVDVTEDDWSMSLEQMEAARTPATVGFISVDLYGHPAKYDALRRAADRLGIWWVSDSAEAVLASDNGIIAGSTADITTFSFFGNKVFTCGEGGAVTTNSDELGARMAVLKNQGVNPTTRYFHDGLAYNYRLTNLQAALLVAQLGRADEIIGSRTAVIERYESNFADASTLVPQPVRAGVVRSPWLMTATIPGSDRTARDAVMSAMTQSGVETRPIFVPMTHLPHLPSANRPTPVSEDLSDRGISLPTYPELSLDQVDEICDKLRSAIGR